MRAGYVHTQRGLHFLNFIPVVSEATYISRPCPWHGVTCTTVRPEWYLSRKLLQAVHYNVKVTTSLTPET